MNNAKINRMLTFGRDEVYGADTGIGKYGIGFKQGSMCIAQSAVVISGCTDDETISFGLLSNKPFEDDKAARQSPLRRFVCNAVTVNRKMRAINGFRQGSTSPQEDYDELMNQIEVRPSVARCTCPSQMYASARLTLLTCVVFNLCLSAGVHVAQSYGTGAESFSFLPRTGDWDNYYSRPSPDQ